MPRRRIAARVRSKACPVCSKAFSYEVGRGTDRKHCSTECRGRLGKERAAAKARPKCSVAGCGKPAFRVSYGLCECCYGRLRRNGTTAPPPPPKYRYKTRGYFKLLRPSHPLADKYGYVLEHRAVVYEATGATCPDCYWCGVALVWAQVSVDHLNEDKADNRPENLVVSCCDCNRMRGSVLPLIAKLVPGRLQAFMKWVEAYHDRVRQGCVAAVEDAA
jgi:predicted nucleic acid-binding Zn ribbon protein